MTEETPSAALGRLVNGYLFDQPHVVAGAAELLEAPGVADRCRVVAGSLFEEVPTGGEYAALFREAGFELVRVTPSESGLQVLEGVPA